MLLVSTNDAGVIFATRFVLTALDVLSGLSAYAVVIAAAAISSSTVIGTSNPCSANCNAVLQAASMRSFKSIYGTSFEYGTPISGEMTKDIVLRRFKTVNGSLYTKIIFCTRRLGLLWGAFLYIEGVGGPNSENWSSFVEISNARVMLESQ